MLEGGASACEQALARDPTSFSFRSSIRLSETSSKILIGYSGLARRQSTTKYSGTVATLGRRTHRRPKPARAAEGKRGGRARSARYAGFHPGSSNPNHPHRQGHARYPHTPPRWCSSEVRPRARRARDHRARATRKRRSSPPTLGRERKESAYPAAACPFWNAHYYRRPAVCRAEDRMWAVFWSQVARCSGRGVRAVWPYHRRRARRPPRAKINSPRLPRLR